MAAAPVPWDSITLSVSVPRYFDVSGHTLYVLSVTASVAGKMLGFEAHRRYAAFVALHDSIYAVLGIPAAFPVPKKVFVGEAVKRHRSKSLEKYLCTVLSTQHKLPPSVLAFIGVPPLGVLATTLYSSIRSSGRESERAHEQPDAEAAARASTEAAISRAVQISGASGEAEPFLPAPPSSSSWLAHAPTDGAIAEALFAPLGGAQASRAVLMPYLRALAKEGRSPSRLPSDKLSRLLFVVGKRACEVVSVWWVG